MICSENMKKINYKSFGLLVIAFSVVVTGFSQQNLVPQPLPCLLINSQNASSLNGLYTNQRCIEVGGEATETAINVYGNNQINLKAGKDIHVASNTHIKPYGNGSVHAYIASDPVEVVWFEPNSTPGFVGKFNRLELGFRLPAAINQQVNNFISNGAGGVNPFDPDQIDFRVHLTAPDGSTLTRFAFYYKPYNENLSGSSANPATIQNDFVQDTTSYPWRFRFAPPNQGLWKISIEILITQNGTTQTITESGITFVCVPSNHKGLLKVSNNDDDSDRWMYFSETGETFFAISENVASPGECGYLPSQNRRHMDGIQKLIDVGGNFTRLELGGHSALPDWDNYKNYITKMDEMYGFDRVLNLCEENDVYFTLFRHHVEMLIRAAWASVRWDNNPYKIGFNIQPIEYFTDETIKLWQKKTLRYIYSRWGYSPNMAFYGYSEVDNWTLMLQKDDTQGSDDEQNGGNLELEECVQVMYPWIQDQQDYIKQNLNGNAMFCHSPARSSVVYGYFYLSDVVSIHEYGLEKEININVKYDKIKDLWDEFNKPIIIEEMGNLKPALYCCTGIESHNSIWATAMMGDFGTGMDWYWDRGVMDFDYQEDLRPLKQFFEGEILREGKYQPQKWKDATFVDRSKLENFALKSENKERVLGWVHNATYYWRNLANDNPCIQNLVNDSYFLNSPCNVAQDPYGFPINYNIWDFCSPREYHRMYNPAVELYLTDYDSEIYEDHFTNDGGTQSLPFWTTFTIKDLKVSGLIKKHWYQIDFFYTHLNNLIPVSGFNASQTIHTDVFSRLNPQLPISSNSANTADFCYKITYLGHYKKSLQNEDTSTVSKQLVNLDILENRNIFVSIYPNPNNGEFQVFCSDEIQKLIIYNILGEKSFEINNVNANKYEVKLNLESGKYLVHILTNSNIIVNKQIIIL
jgi:hypothetical protein